MEARVASRTTRPETTPSGRLPSRTRLKVLALVIKAFKGPIGSYKRTKARATKEAAQVRRAGRRAKASITRCALAVQSGAKGMPTFLATAASAAAARLAAFGA